jgi:Fur family transcriptional regulator, ferric uptake regulator
MKMKIIFNMNRSYSWLNKLKSNGYHLTVARKVVVDIFVACDKVLTPTELFFQARHTYPTIGLVTVYRTIEKLEELGLVQRVFFEEGGLGYYPRNDSHEHLLVCKDCHRVEEFSGDDLRNLMQQVENQSGYEIRDHLLQFSGLCSNCR